MQAPGPGWTWRAERARAACGAPTGRASGPASAGRRPDDRADSGLLELASREVVHRERGPVRGQFYQITGLFAHFRVQTELLAVAHDGFDEGPYDGSRDPRPVLDLVRDQFAVLAHQVRRRPHFAAP